MGTFVNTTTNPMATNTKVTNTESIRSSIINNVTNSMINRITDNPFYFFSNMNKTEVTFYNINKEHTTLDESVENLNNTIGKASGLRFDKINNAVLYGMPRIDVNINIGDFGTEADPIEGEAVILPNTFKPYQQSFFTINYLNTKKLLFFRVVSVNTDTLPNGANFYRINYTLDSIGKDINPQVVGEYYYNSENGSLIDAESYNLSQLCSSLLEILYQSYCSMFFKESVQTFVFRYGPFGYLFYDPYLINFMIRNKVFYSTGYDYIHIDQPAVEPPLLTIDYERSIFRKIEDPSKAITCYLYAYGLLVQDPLSLLTQRIEPYYQITFRDDDGCLMFGNPLLEKINYFDTDLANLIPGCNPLLDTDKYRCTCEEILSGLDQNRLYYKIIYSYLNGDTITSDMLSQISHICFTPCKELYYTIPILVYIIKQVMKNNGITA